MPSARLLTQPHRAPLLLAIVLALTISLAAQTENAQPPTAQTAPPPAVLKSTSRLVSLEVVVRDRNGRPVAGLTAKDFEVSEQLPPKKDRRPQSIAIFQAEDWATLRAASPNPSPLPPGVYSNLGNRKTQVPPTVLLFDGINTDVESQMQVHHQMVRILAAIPADVPVAVFLLGNKLRLLQTFTTDPQLLREAAAKTMVVGQAAPDQDPMDNPDSLAASLDGVPHLPAGLQAALQNFDQATFALEAKVRMYKTLDALRDIARYLDGYPGRKNILWISTSFPLLLLPSQQTVTGSATDLQAFQSSTPNDLRDFQGDMQEVGSALMDAKIAIYPVDPGGVRTQSMFEASARVRQPGNVPRIGQAIQREDTLRQGEQQVMSDLADQTGGRVCTGDNDLGDCVKKAVDDANSYYELAYYPDAGDFRGEFHRIMIKTTHSGVHLSYREGYFARPLGSAEGNETGNDNGGNDKNGNDKGGNNSAPASQPNDPALRRAACEDPLTSTAILVMAQPIPPDQAGAAKYFLAIDSHMLTFTAPAEGVRELGISVAACTFDKTGQPLQFLQKNSLAKLNDQQYTVASHGITQTFQFTPKSEIARVRLLVRDSVSGRIGSVDIPYAPVPTPPPTLQSEPPAPTPTSSPAPTLHPEIPPPSHP
jgi:VWFA-related protein